jgi:hypothetical protein
MMKSRVLDRPMFKGGKMDPDEVGIMSLLMGEDDDEGDEGDESDMARLMDRRPDSPEILMNNLRGDVRSVDARFEELADMVGYDAAQQTPPEVLALLQPVLAAEQQGIAALPAMGPQGGPAAVPTPPMPMPPQGAAGPMPPAASPQGMPPGGIASLPMDQGSVQNFRDGSDEDGVEAEDSEPSQRDAPTTNLGIASRLLTPQQRDAAKAALFKVFSPATASTKTMESRVADATQMYQRLLGQDKSMTQAQMLFDLAGAGLALAGNVDTRTGQPLRGSLVSRLAGAASQLPAQIGARASEAEKMAQQIKLLGIQAAEKEREAERAAGLKREGMLQQLGRDILRGETQEAIAAMNANKPKPSTGLTPAKMNELMSNRDLVQAFAAGADTPETTQLEFAIRDYTQPKTVMMYDPQTQKERPFTTQNTLPDFLQNAVNARAKALGSRPTATAPSTGAAPAQAAVPGAAPAQAAVPGAAPAVAETGAATQTNLYALAKTGTGPLNMLRAGIYSIPVVGGIVDPKYERSKVEITNSVAQLVKGLQETSRLANAEREDLTKSLNLLPGYIDRPAAFQNRLIAVDNVLAGIEQSAISKSKEANIGAQKRQEAELKIEETKRLRRMMGLPVRIQSVEEAAKLPPGTEFLYVPTGQFRVRN